MRTFLTILFFFVVAPAVADTIQGEGEVVDSDVIKIGGERVMLFGLESVERKQACWIEAKPWACYAAAVRHLETLVSEGPMTCETVGGRDTYGRWLAQCMINGKSLNEAFVRSGFAVARSDETEEYLKAEQDAAAEKLGLWQGDFERPADYRISVGILVDRP